MHVRTHRGGAVLAVASAVVAGAAFGVLGGLHLPALAGIGLAVLSFTAAIVLDGTPFFYAFMAFGAALSFTLLFAEAADYARKKLRLNLRLGGECADPDAEEVAEFAERIERAGLPSMDEAQGFFASLDALRKKWGSLCSKEKERASRALKKIAGAFADKSPLCRGSVKLNETAREVLLWYLTEKAEECGGKVPDPSASGEEMIREICGELRRMAEQTALEKEDLCALESDLTAVLAAEAQMRIS